MKLQKKSIILIFSFFLSLFVQVLFAQNGNYTITGTLSDAKDKTPIAYATIQTYLANTTENPVYSCVSDASGKFKIIVSNSGQYNVVLSYVGKQSQTVAVTLKSENLIDLGLIKLEDRQTELGVVEVVAQKPLISIQPDRIVYNVSNDPQASHSNLIAIVQKVPILIVDRESGIMLNNCKPLILINGRKINSVNKDPISFLKNTAASRISKLEIITTPGSKYDGNEICGVLNIITSKTNDTSLMLGTEADSNLGYSLFGDLGFQYNKFIVNTNIAYSSTKKFDSQNHSERINKNDLTNYKLVQQSTNKLIDTGISKTLSVDMSYEFDSLNVINITSGINDDKSNYSRVQLNNMLNYSNNSVYTFNTHENSMYKFGDYNVGVNYEHISKNNKNVFTISALKEVEYNNQSNNHEVVSIVNYSGSHILYNQHEKMDENTFQLDFDHHFKNNSKISIGTKTIFRENTSTSNNYNYLADTIMLNEKFRNSQLIYSFYSEYSFQLKKHLNVNTGLRYEFSQITGGYDLVNTADIDTKFANLLPYLVISSKTQKGILWSCTYNAKIIRPGIVALNPTLYVLDEQNIYYGNPNLTSEYLNKISFDYSNTIQRIKQIAKLSYTFSNNSIQNISGIQNNVYFTSYTNDAKYRDVNLYLYLRSQINTWMQARISGSTSYITLFNEVESNSGFTGNVNASADFFLPNNYQLSMSGMYKFPGITLQGSGFNFYRSSLSASKAFFNDKLNIDLTINNPFGKTKTYNRLMDSDNFHIVSNVVNLGREYLISVSYTINGKEIRVSKVSKEIINQDLTGSKGAQ